MTGLFHRLARQVVGPEPPRARSAARLPFAGPPALEERHAVATHPPEPPRFMEVRDDAMHQAESREYALRAQALPPRLMHAAEPGEPRPGGSPAASADTRTDAGEDRPTQREASPDGPATPEPAFAASAAVEPRAPRRPVEPAAPLLRRASPAPDTPPPPRPLLPEVSAPADAARQSPSPTPPGPSRADAADPPEVHVHIGRIDVTSVSEPQRRRDPPRRAAPRMSLEDYLAGRKSGGP